MTRLQLRGGLTGKVRGPVTFGRASAVWGTDDSGALVQAASGTPFFNSHGLLLEPAATNYFLNSDAPVTQTITLGTGTYTVSLPIGTDSGTMTSAAGTAVGSGFGAASAVASNTFTLTSGGTITITKAGTVSKCQVENLAYKSSYIPTAGASAARAATTLTIGATGNVKAIDFTWYLEISILSIKAAPNWPTFIWLSLDGGNYLALQLNNAAKFYVTKSVGGASANTGLSSITATAGGTYKCAVRFSSVTGLSLFISGVLMGSNPSTTFFVPSAGTPISFGVADMCRCIKDFRVYKKALSDAKCSAITS
jgi:hypothetical protein